MYCIGLLWSDQSLSCFWSLGSLPTPRRTAGPAGEAPLAIALRKSRQADTIRHKRHRQQNSSGTNLSVRLSTPLTMSSAKKCGQDRCTKHESLRWRTLGPYDCMARPKRGAGEPLLRFSGNCSQAGMAVNLFAIGLRNSSDFPLALTLRNKPRVGTRTRTRRR